VSARESVSLEANATVCGRESDESSPKSERWGSTDLYY
jgi:hypothetical protein